MICEDLERRKEEYVIDIYRLDQRYRQLKLDTVPSSYMMRNIREWRDLTEESIAVSYDADRFETLASFETLSSLANSTNTKKKDYLLSEAKRMQDRLLVLTKEIAKCHVCM